MQIRFFNDWGPDGRERLLIGVSPDDEDRGQAREAVRVATAEDVELHRGPYEAYLATFRERQQQHGDVQQQGDGQQHGEAAPGTDRVNQGGGLRNP